MRTTLAALEAAAEARDLSELKKHLSATYKDAFGHERDEALRAARGYFIANQRIHLATRIEELDFPSDREARAKVQVGMLGRDGENGGALDLGAELRGFDLVLQREGDEWKVTYADWRVDAR